MQFAAEIFRVKTGAKFTSVPYRGGALATGAVVTGEVHLAFSNMSDAMGQLGGELGARRSPSPRPNAARIRPKFRRWSSSGWSTTRSSPGTRCSRRPARRSRSSTGSRR